MEDINLFIPTKATRSHPVLTRSLDKLKHGDQNTLNPQNLKILEGDSKPLEVDSNQRKSHSNLERRRKQTFYARLISKQLTTGLKFSPLMKQYLSTENCSRVMVQDGGKLKTFFCNCRWCPVCSNIRTGKAINRYRSEVESWSDLYFVTLTIKNVQGKDLKTSIQKMVTTFYNCVKSIKRTHKKTFTAIRTLEVTYNSKLFSYHPHFHVLIEGKEQAELLKLLWLKLISKLSSGSKEQDQLLQAGEQGQNVKPADPNTLKELFKYSTKLMTKQDDGKEVIHAPSLDVIFTSIKGMKLWQTFGFKIESPDPELEPVEETLQAPVVATKLIYWVYDDDLLDWVDLDTGELLLGSEVDPKVQKQIDRLKITQTLE